MGSYIDATRIRLEIDQAAQHLIGEFQMHNEQISEAIHNGVKQAVENFDFENEVAAQCQGLIKQAVRDFVWNSQLKKLVEEKMNRIIDNIIDKEIGKFK